MAGLAMPDWGYAVTCATEVRMGTSASRDHQTVVKSGSRSACVDAGYGGIEVGIPY